VSPVQVKDFGKDHWSLLAYVETTVVDNQKAPGVGGIDPNKLRCNANTHSELMGHLQRRMPTWEPKYGTRLRGFWNKDKTTNPTRQISDHDDWDCLENLETCGFIEILSLVNGFIRLTPEGMSVCQQIREHKANGGMFATFSL